MREMDYGPDGWPLPLFECDEVWKRGRALGKVEWRLWQWRNGDRTAPFRALQECRLADLPPPTRLVDAVRELTIAAMPEEEKRARLAWRKHQARWKAVTELRERRHELQAHGDDRGMSLEKARAAVAEALADTDADGRESTIKNSYDLVKAAGGQEATFETYQAELQRRSNSRKRLG